MVILLGLIVSCESDPEQKSVFDGEWNWKESNGVDTTFTPFHKDPTTEGQIWTLQFYDSNGTAGTVKSIEGSADSIFHYEYTISSNPTQQKLIMWDQLGDAGSLKIYYWEITYIDKVKYLHLRNSGYFTIGCCEYKEEHIFTFQ